jgi:hypothetical protein
MGDKSKRKETGSSGKKPKAAKQGNRPHEQRAREAVVKGTLGPTHTSAG